MMNIIKNIIRSNNMRNDATNPNKVIEFIFVNGLVLRITADSCECCPTSLKYELIK